LSVPGGDSRLPCPIKTMAGGSAVNSTTHLTCLLQNFRKKDLAPPQVKLHTCVNPNDEYGKMLLNHATKHGFPLFNCKRQDSERATGHCVITVTDDDRSFMTHQGCMHDFDASDLNVDTLVNSPTNTAIQHSHIHVAGYYNIPGFWNVKLQEILERERLKRKNLPHQTTTTISLVPQHDATEEWDGGLLDLLPLLDFVIMNELEADCISRSGRKTEMMTHKRRFNTGRHSLRRLVQRCMRLLLEDHMAQRHYSTAKLWLLNLL